VITRNLSAGMSMRKAEYKVTRDLMYIRWCLMEGENVPILKLI
jgi:hypothetical protein